MSLTYQNGTLVKLGDPTRRYIGTVFTNAATQLEDSRQNRLVYNFWNQLDSEDWTWSSQSFNTSVVGWEAFAGGAAAFKKTFIVGYQNWRMVSGHAQIFVNAPAGAFIAFGLNSTVSPAATDAISNYVGANIQSDAIAKYAGYPPVGLNFLQLLDGGDTNASKHFGTDVVSTAPIGGMLTRTPH